MHRRLILAIGLVLATPMSMAEEDRELPLEVLDEVLVTGTQPGPALWQVKSGTNVLWVLAVVPRLSKGIKWRSKQVERVLADAREVLAIHGTAPAPAATPAEVLSQKEMAVRLDHARYLPDGQTLRDVLPSDMYARFETAKATFPDGGKNKENDMERSRPDRARNLLVNRAIQALKLGISPVSDKVVDMARKRRVKLTRIGYLWSSGAIPIPSPAMIEAAMDICPLDELLRDLEGGGARWKARANAWAVGDVKRFKELLRPDARTPQCELRKPGKTWLTARDVWLAAMERSLANSSSALAVVDASMFLSVDGVLDALRSRGYEVVEP